MSDVHDDDDVDSLFGSPPPSPHIDSTNGRSFLALPCTHGTGNGVLPKNVGTIALPGSHDGAEPIVNLPASPPRQPAQAHTLPDRHLVQLRVNPLPDRARSSFTTSGKSAAKAKGKERASKPVVEPPKFSFPGDSEPLPPNFLRNQQALLGIAGVIGGINPARLSTCINKGTSADNPIIVDDGSVSETSSWQTNLTQKQLSSAITSLTALMSMLGVNVDVDSLYPASQLTPPAAPPPPKKRKRGHVPAGAKDWDVPFPFAPEEAPAGYREKWGRDRERKVLIQLVRVLKDIVGNASRRLASQLGNATTMTVLGNQAGTNLMTACYPSTSWGNRVGVSNMMPELSFPGVSFEPQVVDALTNTRSTLHQRFQSASPLADAEYTSQPPQENDPEALQNLHSELELWLSSMESIDFAHHPFPNDIVSTSPCSSLFSSTATNSPALTASTRLATPADIPLLSTSENKENSAPNLIGCSEFVSSMPDGSDCASPGGAFAIDPLLLDITETTPGAVPDPDHHAGTDPLSQRYTIPEPACGGYNQQGAPTQSQPLAATVDTRASCHARIPELAQVVQTFPISTGVPTFSPYTPYHASAQIPYQPQPASFIPYFATFQQTKADEPPLNIAQAVSSQPRATSSKQAGKTLDRTRILNRAKHRREQLEAEIARAKVELWETSIEQGVLLLLSKDKSLD